jgi:hypothetical protein
MSWKMEFWNSEANFGMLDKICKILRKHVKPFIQVTGPLASDVISDKNKKNSDGVQCTHENEVHVDVTKVLVNIKVLETT